MNYTEKYLKYKNALEIQSAFRKLKKIGQLKFDCECGEIIQGLSIASHQRICDAALRSRERFMKKLLNTRDKCVCCDKLIDFKKFELRALHRIVTCSAKCSSVLKSYVYVYETNFKKCKTCQKETISKWTTCSKECSRKAMGLSIKADWKKSRKTDKYRKRVDKINKGTQAGKERAKLNGKVYVAWNSGLKGWEYIKHFEKEDGSNSLYDSLKRNAGFFKKTSLERNFESILVELNLRFQYSFFSCNRQFDFIIDFDQYRVVVETDGDYYHKSSRWCHDVSERQMKRLEDKLKSDIIYHNIKNTDKVWHVIRFWEYNVNNNKDIITDFLKKLKENGNNKPEFENIVSEIKKYYEKNS